ncbi:unnamed protein product [Miscanthus lutarioriparius]|uniref:Endoplasmic reticulum transmembrane protein n=1 Tax=Miscanthus lutarioriparius TaxID=422564 RepID=A0A811S926_9POAL|nr:unnamed protein product [Miscanthus lutarioriparius]
MSPSAIFVFLLVSALHMLECILDLVKRRGSISDEQLKLRVQITELLKEASALSTPSTFAQAAKLKRLAGAKEKELAKMQELNIKGKQSLYEQYGKALLATKFEESHQIRMLGSNLRCARSVVLEYSCDYCS